MSDLVILWERLTSYLSSVFTGAKPVIGIILTTVTMVIFPDDAFKWALLAVLGASAMDMVTKLWAICKECGGYTPAIRTGRLFSKTLWEGTSTKMFSYLVMSILTGLSYRVIYLQQIGIFLATFVYSMMFLREFQSNIENLIEGGADLHYMLLFGRKKEHDIMKEYTDFEELEKLKKEEKEEREKAKKEEKESIDLSGKDDVLLEDIPDGTISDIESRV